MTDEYAPRHQHDKRLRELCFMVGIALIFLIACTGVYLAIEAMRYDLGGLFVILLVPSVVVLMYLLVTLKLEDAWRDFKGWRERRRGRTTNA